MLRCWYNYGLDLTHHIVTIICDAIAAAAPNCSSTLPTNGIVVEGIHYTIECNIYFGAASGIFPETTWSGPGDFNQLSVNQTGTVLSGVGFDVQKVMDTKSFSLLSYFSQRGFGGVDYADNIPDWSNTYTGITLFVRCKYRPDVLYITL